jgi:hypothetical protein
MALFLLYLKQKGEIDEELFNIKLKEYDFFFSSIIDVGKFW